jgi:hypothetical protein
MFISMFTSKSSISKFSLTYPLLLFEFLVCDDTPVVPDALGRESKGIKLYSLFIKGITRHYSDFRRLDTLHWLADLHGLDKIRGCCCSHVRFFFQLELIVSLECDSAGAVAKFTRVGAIPERELG